MDISQAKRFIRGMLDLAANEAASPSEKEQAMRRVTKLMDEHNLSEADLPDADGILDSLDNIEPGFARVDVGKKQCMWMSALCVFVERLLGTIKTHSVRTKEGVNCVFYGFKADCDIAAEIYFEVRDYMECAAGTKGYSGTKRGDGYSYCIGFATGLQEQLKRAQVVTGPVSTNALVVKRNEIVVKKQSLATRYANALGIKSKQQKSRYRGQNTDAFANGFHDGLKHGVNTDRRKKLA